MTETEILEVAREALDILQSADWDNPVSPPWSHPSKTEKDWLVCDAQRCAAWLERVVPNYTREDLDGFVEVIPFVEWTINRHGYVHKGRAGSSVRQLQMLIEHLERRVP